MNLPSPIFSTKTNEKTVDTKQNEENSCTKATKVENIHFIAYCKFCKEGFKSHIDLSQHRQAHQRCPYEQCKFNASEKVVAEHIQKVHIKRNVLTKIQDLTTPEQIEKWREERRKRYPTIANVQLRQQAREFRSKRGERLVNPQSRFGDQKRKEFRSHHNKNHSNHRKDEGEQMTNSQRFNKFNREQNNKDSVQPRKCEIKLEELVKHKAEKFQSTKHNLQAAVDMDDDSDCEEITKIPFKGTLQMKNYHKMETIVKTITALSVLGVYDSEYESSSESEINENSTIPKPSGSIESEENQQQLSTEYAPIESEEIQQQLSTQSAPKASEENQQQVPPHSAPIQGEENQQQLPDCQEDDCENDPEDIPQTLPIERDDKAKTIVQDKDRRFEKRSHDHSVANDRIKKPRTLLDYAKLRKSSANSFLEKLLQDDIRHERNVLLQCVNYVVKNDFFGVGRNNTRKD
ncbi:CLUMA_CG014411, isoform A [Clunio marinus]|uniref:CLUMA_CG014411, isoform A n=1 Tax=Clunio marinus TaxID=568069 RepID=A0A1J1INW8_9DIPT|nr:CLUMA_CG014411, isoform A [Clunio marinus]